MTRLVEMLQCMSVLGVLAAADVTADETDAQLVPLRADGNAILAAIGAGRHGLDRAEVFAGLGHVGLCVGDADDVSLDFTVDGTGAEPSGNRLL